MVSCIRLIYFCLTLISIVSVCFANEESPDKKILSKVFEDNHLSCEEANKYSSIIAQNESFIDLGSGGGSTKHTFERGCPSHLLQLKPLKTLIQMTELIRGHESNDRYYCQGTLAHAGHRYFRLDTLLAGIAPHIYFAKEDSNSFVLTYLKYWSRQSLYNYKLYHRYMSLVEEGTDFLAKHYQRKFNFSESDAKKFAKKGILLFISRAAGTVPEALVEKIGQEINIGEGTSLEMLTQRLQSAKQDQKDSWLRHALLLKKPAVFIKRILESGASINTGDESPIFYALESYENTKLLIESGAKVDYENSFGKTPLYYAIQFNKPKLIKLLIENGANANHHYKSYEELKLLGWKGCMSSGIYRTKRTPLHHAAQHASIQVFDFLITQGADILAIDEQGYNVIDYADSKATKKYWARYIIDSQDQKTKDYIKKKFNQAKKASSK